MLFVYIRSLGLTKASQGVQPKVEILFCKVSVGHGKQGKSCNLIDGPAKSLKIKFMLGLSVKAELNYRKHVYVF